MTRSFRERLRFGLGVGDASQGRVRWFVAASAIVVAAMLGALPAAAFWPFTRDAPAAADTMLTESKVADRFGAWTVGGSASLAAAPGERPATSTPGAPAPGSPAAPPVTASDLARGLAARDTTRTSAPPDTTSLAGSSLPAPTPAPPDSLGAVLAPMAPSDSTSLLAAPPNGTPGTPGAPAPSDALAAAPPPPAVAAAMVSKGFAPDFNSKLTSSNDYVKLSSDLSATFTDPSGISLSSLLNYAEDISLTQHTELRGRGMNNTLSMPFRRLGVNFGISTFNRKSDQTARTISNASTANRTDDKGAEASLGAWRRLDRIPGVRRLGRPVRGWSVNGFVAHRANQSFQDIVATQGTGSGQRSHSGRGNSYGVGTGYNHFKWMTLKARVGTTRLDNLDRSKTLPNGETTSTSEGDTATVDVTVPTFWKTTNLVFGYRAVNSNDSYTDQVRSTTGGQTGTIGNFALETKRTTNRTLTFGMRFKPWTRTDIGLSVNAGRDSTTYDLRQNAFIDNNRISFKLDSKWLLSWGTNLTANYESSAIDVNQDEGGHPNANTRRDEERKAYLELQKGFTKTCSIRLYADMQLNQGFYEHEGPSGFQDRDDLRWRFGGDFNGAIGENVTANVTAYVREYDQIFTDARTSANCRNEQEYVVRNGYTWRVLPRITIGQNFGLSSKVLEVVFKPEQNTLNRNHFMNTRFGCQITPRLTVDTNYDYLLQDNGGYVRVPGRSEPLFAPTTRTKKDGIGVGMRFDIIHGGKLVFTSRQESTRERSTRFDGRPATISERGNLALGFESKLQVKDLKLDCRAQRNQSFNIALNRAVYYNVDATLQYTF